MTIRHHSASVFNFAQGSGLRFQPGSGTATLATTTTHLRPNPCEPAWFFRI
ncbi:hypothetical protein Vi05172_g4657 [Venturia inaequalis]|nr:hypothetical protein Vi05172_g4657 [Venturia inaequalis]